MLIPTNTTAAPNPAGRIDRLTLHPEWGPVIDKVVPQAGELAERATRLQEVARGIPVPVIDLQGAVLAALDADPVPDLVQVVADANGAARRHQQAQTTLSALYVDLQQQRADLVYRNADKILQAMNERLQEIVTAYRDNAAYQAGVASAESAIAARLVKPWQELLKLEDTYESVRSMHAAFITGILQADGALLMHTTPELLHMANPHEAHPDYLDQRADKAEGRDPWPDTRASAGQWLRYLADTPKARPWIPSPAQLEELQDRLTAAVRERRDPARRRSVPGRGNRLPLTAN